MCGGWRIQLFKKYGNTAGEPWKKYGRVNDWNIDLVPKLLMSNGELTNILVSTDVTRYLEFKQIAGSFVQQGRGPKATVAKVPSDSGEALRSPLMGLFEKRRARNFLEWVGAYKSDDPATHKGRDSVRSNSQLIDANGILQVLTWRTQQWRKSTISSVSRPQLEIS
jgi:Rab GDP dissociation inhibitor